MKNTIEILAGLRQRGIVPQHSAAESHALLRERSPEEREAEDRSVALTALRQRSPQSERELGITPQQASALVRDGLVARAEDGLRLTYRGMQHIRGARR